MKPIIKRQNTQSLPLQIVCSTKFGRHPKISTEQTWNMFISDNFMVQYAGHEKVLSIVEGGYGRGAFVSERGNFILAVVDEEIYIIDNELRLLYIAALETSSGEVFIAENNAFQIGICDQVHIYILNYVTRSFSKVTTDFTPASLAFQDGYFIAAVKGEPKWRLSDPNNGLSWSADAANVGVLQAPDNVLHCVPMPNIQGQLFVFGSTVTHCFNNLPGSMLFPYVRNNSFAIDYGCVNPATIAAGDNFIIWLGGNNKSGLAVMYSQGGKEQQISTDGINLKLEKLVHPEKSYGALVKIDGHLFYQLSFVDKEDNFTLAFDFSTKTFLFVSDANQNHHEARKIVYFNNKYYFISFDDGNLYEMGSDFNSCNGKEIPRIIITPTIRLPDTMPFICQSLYAPIVQGEKSERHYTDPLHYIGEIAVSSDFPSLDDVVIGDMYKVTQPVTDNDEAKTNTGQLFGICEIVWNGDKWDVIKQEERRIDLSVSRDGGVTFGCPVSKTLNDEGKRKNILSYYGLGRANELTLQFRFYGYSKYIIGNGEVNIYQ